jgi:tRNA dimethylallyltransferase
MVATLLIAGPTASGKSALALELAEQLGGTIINADSMQVYRDLSVLTARPTAADMGRVPHRLFGHVDAAENYSVGRFVRDAEAAIAQAHCKQRLAIVVGGTGLYFRALTVGMSAIPTVPDAVRRRIRDEAAGLSADELYQRLRHDDPVTAARLRPTDPQRILRALEIFAATGLSLARLQLGKRRPVLTANWQGIFVAPPRHELGLRIEARFEAMIAAGALREVAALKERNLDRALPAMRAHGVPGLIDHLSGRCSLAEAIERGKADTKRYAKRQYTWARHQLPGFQWLAVETFPLTAARFLALLRQLNSLC